MPRVFVGGGYTGIEREEIERRAMGNNQPFEFAAEFVRDTDAAVLLNDGNKEVWVPRSLLTELDTKGKLYAVPYWFAVKRGIV